MLGWTGKLNFAQEISRFRKLISLHQFIFTQNNNCKTLNTLMYRSKFVCLDFGHYFSTTESFLY